MRSRLLGAVCVCTLAVCLPALANAMTVRHEFTGHVTEVNYVGGDPFGGQIQVGTLFNGYYEYDSTQLPFEGDACDIKSQCRWEFPIPPYQFAASWGPVTIGVPDFYQIIQTNGILNTNDEYSVSSAHSFDVIGELLAIQLALRDTTIPP